MEFENKSISQKPTSILEGDGYHVDRLLLREPSIGYSSRIYYRTCEGVPFQWEVQPGQPKYPLKNDVISPLTPPPAHQNTGLPRPCLDKEKEPWFKLTSKRIMFWKKKKKPHCKVEENKETMYVDRVESLGTFDSGREFECSSGKNSSMSSSSSVSSSEFPHLEQPKGSVVCSPWDITTTVFPFAKRG